jgi:hypothetical protein
MVSPQNAEFKAFWRFPPAFTEMMLPFAGVLLRVLTTDVRGSSAGPSKVLVAPMDREENTARHTTIRTIETKEFIY